ncbi:DnaJ domain containing protein [Trichuris trichiura]|uniref:DnaJ domain containing protein n=1 Tax=Trichuris trichiura TaxID=36087 RepID=A0A077ZEK9_TRITR|nr:DnaJ domain containing protein [Trichuris trichiura]
MLNEASELQFDLFYADLKKTERDDSTLTSKNQIYRLLRPGATYFNLNPYDKPTVVKCHHLFSFQLSILVHPDKNPDDRENAQKAFDVLKKALETLENPNQRARIRLIYEEAKARTDKAVLPEKRRMLKKYDKDAPSQPLLEDDPDVYRRLIWTNTIKVFAEKERKRRALMEREMEDKLNIQRTKLYFNETTQNGNGMETRDDRVTSWKNFKTKKDSKGRLGKGGFRPPKHKAESRS